MTEQTPPEQPAVPQNGPVLPPAGPDPAPALDVRPPSLPQPSEVLAALRAPLRGFAVAFGIAVVAMILILIASAVDSDGTSSTDVDSDTIQAIGVLIGMPFQLVGMALLGRLHAGEDGFDVTVMAPPLLITLAYLVVTARTARTAVTNAETGTRAVIAAAAGLATAVAVTPLAWALAMRDDGVALHTASVGLFFGAWILTGAAVFVGAHLGAGHGRPAWIPAEYVEAIRLFVHQLVLWILVAAPVLAIAGAINDGIWFALLIPLWIVTLGIDTFAIGHLGGVSVFVATAHAWDFSAVWAVLLLAGAALLTLISATTWSLRRDPRVEWLANPASWAVLPAIWFGGALLVLLVPTVSLGGGFDGFGASASVRPSALVLLALPAFGLVIEALSRTVGPGVAAALPVGLRTFLKGTPVAVPGQPTGSAPTAPAPVAPRAPMSDAEKARWKKIGILGGIVVLLVGGASIAISVVNSAKYSAEATAAAYLDAVVDGDVDKILELAPVDEDEGSTALLTDEVFASAKNRITGYDIVETESIFGSTYVTVKLEGVGPDTEDEIELEMEQDGKKALVFDSWKVTGNGLATAIELDVPDGSEEIAVGDTDATVADDGSYWLLPGTYVFDPYVGNKYLEAGDGGETTVSAGSFGGYAELPEAAPTQEFRDEVDTQVAAFLERCMAATDLDPDGCPQSTYASGEVRNVRWTLEQAPEIDYDYFDGSFPFDLSTSVDGTAAVTYEYDASYGFGAKDWQAETETGITFYLDGDVEEVGGELQVTFDH